MKKVQITAILLAVLGTTALTACGKDPITADSTPAETTAVTEVTETTAEEAVETTEATKKTTAAEKDSTETATEAAETDTETTVTEAAATTAEAAQQTEAPATQAPQTEAPAPATEAPKQEQHLFDALKLGQSAENYRTSHTNFTKIESDACLSGKNYEYTYPDFVLLVNVDNGVEKIQSIKITGPGISTREGIHVGSTREEVQNAYGPEESVDFFTKKTADGNIEVTVEHGVVTEIFLYAE